MSTTLKGHLLRWAGRTVLAPREASNSEEESRGFSCVIHDSNILRRAWNVVTFVMLVYIAIVLPYHFCFVEFSMSGGGHVPPKLAAAELAIDALFWVDLFLNFFFTFRDAKDKEVTSLRRITRRYLSTYFVPNFVACLPSEAIGWIIGVFIDPGSPSAHKGVRLMRLQRISRLARLLRLARFGKLAVLMYQSRFLRYLQSFRGMRVVNFIAFFMWMVHVVACGWYLCAALHINKAETWVARRILPDDVSLIDASKELQWAHAMYFVMTVFTTVGFGDMSAFTLGEIIYVVVAMVAGAIAHSIILSEVITIITSVDKRAQDIKAQQAVVDGFAQHAGLTDSAKELIMNWAGSSRSLHHSFDRKWMKDLIAKGIPRKLAGAIPKGLFGGRLLTNRFLKVCTSTLEQDVDCPPRFAMFLAVALQPRYFEKDEIVYFSHDHAWDLFFVMEGVFSNIAKPTPSGGVCQLPALAVAAAMNTSSESVSKRLSSARRMGTRSIEACMEKQLENSYTVVPYTLYCYGNYFGEAELLLEWKGPRRTSTRCEKAGQLLTLNKSDLFDLMTEYRRFTSPLRAAAQRRESHREILLHRLTEPRDYRNLAAVTIQNFTRNRRQSKDGAVDVGQSNVLAEIRERSSHRRRTQPASVPRYVCDLMHDVEHVKTELADMKESIGTGMSDIRAEIKQLAARLATSKKETL
mmetsp:Transcript_46357/g.128973  ORF Transcript_46357/g.128973 Transcript_46357/m.128973 type:complete len:692 (-) Transcript_46357:104-2179(-)